MINDILKINIDQSIKYISVVYNNEIGQTKYFTIQGQNFDLLRKQVVNQNNTTIYNVIKNVLYKFVNQQHLV